MTGAAEFHGQGLLLTRSSHDAENTTVLEFWVASDRGPVLLKVTGERPVFFIEERKAEPAMEALSARRNAAQIKPLDLKTFGQQPVTGVYSPGIRAGYQARDILDSSGITVYEGDIRLHERYLTERFVGAGVEFHGHPVRHDRYLEIRNARIKPAECRLALRSLSLDIECDRDFSLFSVGLAGDGVEEILIIGEPVTGPPQALWCRDEADLISRLERRLQELDPDVILGWNLVNFDLRILLERARLHRLPFRIGRDGTTPVWRSRKEDVHRGFIYIPGRLAIDGIDALKTATYRFASFSLEHVARQLLGRGKRLEGDKGDRVEEIRRRFLEAKIALMEYNLEDCRLVQDIFSHTRLMDFLVLRSQLTGLEIDRVGGSVAAFCNLYMPKLHRCGYVAPNLAENTAQASPGGYVMDSKPGLYRNILVLDFKSFYPSIILTFKVDPMGMVEGLANPHDGIEGYLGAIFDREKHLLPGIIETLWKERDRARLQNDDPRSHALKILMNSFYGVLGTSGCRFNDERLVSSITLRGHHIMKTTGRWIEEMGHPVIYMDTDSTFVWIGDDATPADARTAGEGIARAINRRWHEEIRQVHSLACRLEFEFEASYRRFLMPTIRGADVGSKKRYAGLIETEDGAELVFKGLENVRADWTPLAREFQYELYRLVFTDRDPSEYVRRTVTETLSGQHDTKLAYCKQLRRPLDTYVRSQPPHVRAARIADEENARLNRRLQYQSGGRIEYVMTTNGPEPIECRSSSIDHRHYVDKQLKPVAEGILPFVGLDFEALTSLQDSIL